MSAEAPCVMTCSWGSDDALQGRVRYTFVGEGGMEEAEAAMEESIASPPDSSLTFPAGSAAPWLTLHVGDTGVVALCFVTNARVLEIHDAVDDTSAPLLTQEAQVSNPATGLHGHFVCHGGSGVLFPPRRAYRLKLFARTPKASVIVASVCVVLFSRSISSSELGAERPSQSFGSQGTTQPLNPAIATLSAVIMEVSTALQRQLLVVESRIGGALNDVARRLTDLEGRVSRLETTSDVVPKTEVVDSVTPTLPASLHADGI
ncbi:hypothetical protein GH5_08046 [Leishmania sp. Ghana 2012 LV757]|uniref:hypothetical protein n=1 Tax=Leishmania sp. Ghana 2012 LV757 TaxID=2803181 RepID=UPI001B763163|nr:hypothetical protein GH5_08046 [Leishmania sp. Ghana 2012 LV757]